MSLATAMMLKDAFGVDVSYRLSDAEIEELRAGFHDIVPYIVLFTARSGSTFLTHEIANARVLSTPNEWFNWLYVIEDRKKHGGGFVDYVKRLVATHKSEQGIFGIETNRLMLELFEQIVPVNRIFSRKPRWFFLRRRNLVGQSISNYIADQSRVFHSYQLNPETAGKVSSVEYDGEKIEKYIRNFVDEESWCMKRFEAMDIVPLELFYEDLVSDPKRTAKLFANVLGVGLPPEYLTGNVANPMKRLANDKNKTFEARFRDENAGFLEEALALRPLVLAPATSV